MGEGYIVRSLSPMRRVIAARMQEAYSTIPHFRASADIEVDKLLAVRDEWRRMSPSVALSLNDLLVKASAEALMDVPEVNIQWSDGELHQFVNADISIVVAVKGGLVTPIVREANLRSVPEISARIRDLTARAARNELKMEEITGGSFSISNLGMHGVDHFDAIINPPQCAILAVGSAKQRCLAGPDGQVRMGTVLRATISADHRAIDGVVAARFLSALRTRIEQPSQAVSALETPCNA
ncbi:MAG: 2-oxo acid dehydrogenase subunit E2 [Steroidobacteraceae bacterium]